MTPVCVLACHELATFRNYDNEHGKCFYYVFADNKQPPRTSIRLRIPAPIYPVFGKALKFQL